MIMTEQLTDRREASHPVHPMALAVNEGVTAEILLGRHCPWNAGSAS